MPILYVLHIFSILRLGIPAAGEKDLMGARKTSFDCIKKGAFAVIIVDIPLILFGKFLLEQFTQQPQILKMVNIIYADYNMYHNSIDIATYTGYILQIDCNKAEEDLKTTPSSE